MGFLSKYRPKEKLEDVLEKFFGENELWKTKGGSVSILSKLVNTIRPRKWKPDTKVDISNLLNLLKNNPIYLSNLQSYLFTLLNRKRFDKILTDGDIIKDVSFIYELKQRIVAKFIPQQPDFDSLEYILTQVFYVDGDGEWVESIEKEQLLELYDVLFSDYQKEDGSLKNFNQQLRYAIQILMSRITGVASEHEVIKMVPEFEEYENPFIALSKEINDFLDRIIDKNEINFEKEDIDYRQVNILINQCEDYISQAYKNTQKFGISIRVNQYLLRMKQQLDRVKNLVDIIISWKGQNQKERLVDFAVFLIAINYQKNNIRSLLNKGTQRVAFEITQQKAKTGEHYITKDKQEYNKMLHAALGGGGIVGLMCIAKLLLSKLSLSPFGMAFVYSLNYAIGFILIYILGYTLATKQPAMTASSFIKSLQDGQKAKKKGIKYRNFSILFSRLFRSQFIAFVGNVVLAFPVALIGIWLIDILADVNIAEGKGEKKLASINPTTSLAIFHASIAGIWLFLSGVIAGNVGNRIRHNKIPFRIQEHPMLKMLIGRKRALKLANYHEKKYPGIVSNLIFGIFMGSTASLGYILGLNLDIRHITFASGDLALGLYGAQWQTTMNMLIWAIIGVGLIGFFNFIVSFTLSIIVAMRSCAIPILELRNIIFSVFQYFLKNPLHFFFPLEDEPLE